MAIRRRSDVFFVDFRYTNPQTGETRRFRRSTGRGTSKKEAIELERQWHAEVSAPPSPTVKTAGFSDFAGYFLTTYIQPNRKRSYAKDCESIFRNHLVPVFGDTGLRSISVEQVERLKAQKARQLKPKTVNNILGVLSICFRKAIEWGYADANPVSSVGLLRLPPQEFNFWDEEQSDAFLAALLQHEPKWHPYFFTLLRTGLRLGESFALRPLDVLFDKRRILVVWNYVEGVLDTPKNGKRREVPMSPQLARVLEAHRPRMGERVFPGSRDGFLTRDQVKRPFDRAVKAAGVPSIRLHDLRHSFASQLVMKGVPLVAVRQYLGHSDIKMTLRYAHLAPAIQQDWIARLDAPMAEDSGHKMGTLGA